MSAEDMKLMDTLKAKKKAGTITAEEQKKLDELMKSAPADKPAGSG